MHTLLTVLDWGLGHASRSLALARWLEGAGDRISWASSGPAAEMLRRELPGRTVHELPPYAVRYPGRSMVLNVARQLPRWWRTVGAERVVTVSLAERLGVDRIVSDSRFGCYHPDLPSVFLTHQLYPEFPLAPATSAVYRNYLQRHFDEFWVPDEDGPYRLSGKLSRGGAYRKVRYIGQLSRLSPTPGIEPFGALILLSGPEPMRTRLENIIFPQLASLSEPYHLVRGLPDTQNGYADAATLSQLLVDCRYVVARPGYSSLMDIRAFRKPAVLIPTPGQTEQMYLAMRAAEQGWAVAEMEQEKLDLAVSIQRLAERL